MPDKSSNISASALLIRVARLAAGATESEEEGIFDAMFTASVSCLTGDADSTAFGRSLFAEALATVV
jgi:hypothetical protein